MHKRTEIICGFSELKPNFEEIGNNPNFVFENDPNFETIKLFDQAGNVVNVNSWLECANYVNGNWTNNISDFYNGEMILFFFIGLVAISVFFLNKKFNLMKWV